MDNQYNSNIEGFSPEGNCGPKIKSFPPEHYEKRAVRNAALIIGIASLCPEIVALLWPKIYLFFTMNIAGMSFERAAALSEDAAMQQLLQITLSIFMFLVPFGIAARVFGGRAGELISFGKPDRSAALPMLLIGIGFCSFSNVATTYASFFFNGFGIEYEVDFGDNPQGVFGFALSVLATAVVPALVEEFACRGVIIGLLKKHGETFAIVTSSIVFGIMHGNFEQMPFAVMVGLVLGFIYIKTGSIWISVAVHFVNNLISVVFSYMPSGVSAEAQDIMYYGYLMLSMFAAVVGAVLISHRQEAAFSLEKAETVVSEKQKYKWFFTQAAIIIFVVVNIIGAFSYFV